MDLARTRLGLERETPVRAFKVLRTEPPGGSYYLLVFGEPNAAVAVAAVDVSTGEVTNWANLPGTAPHRLIDAQSALRCAGMPGDPPTQLVWTSSPASRSLFYPVWQVGTGDDRVYVDQKGKVWQSLDSNQRGG
jgi:hypothetical protein